VGKRASLALLVLVLGAAALVAAGCGGDDGEGSAAETDTTMEQTEEQATGTTETMEDDGSTEGASTDGSVDLGTLTGECAELAAVGARIAQTLGSQGGGDVEASAEYFSGLADAAPDEIKDDLEVFAKGFAEYAKAISGIDLGGGTVPTAEDLAKLQDAAKAFDDPQIQEASDNIQAWADENCTTG
jgi:hypothetical protein